MVFFGRLCKFVEELVTVPINSENIFPSFAT